MMNISEVREKFPQYDDLDDEALLRGLHKTYYADMPYGDFSATIEAPEPEQGPRVPGGDKYLYNESGTVAGINPEYAASKADNQQFIEGFGNTVLNAQGGGYGDRFVGLSRALMDAAVETDVEQQAREMEGAPKRGFLDAVGEDYDMYKQASLDSRDAFSENNPKTALGTNLLGGFASPLNKILPGFGMAGSTVAPVVARGAGEGAVIGYGESRAEDLPGKLWDATRAAAFGAGTAGTLTGLGRTGEAIAKRRRSPDEMFQEVDGETVQVPITLQGIEDRLTKFFRNTVGRSLGGRGAIEAQEAPFLDVARQNVDDAKGAVTQADEALKQAKKDTAKNATDTTRAIDDDLAAARAAAKVEAEATTQQAKRQAEQTTEAARERLRIRTAEEAMPENARALYDDVDMTDTAEVNNVLKNYWGNDAFQEVKGRQFDWDGDIDAGLAKSIRTAISEDPELALTAQNRLGEIGGLIERLKRAGMSTSKDMAPEDFIEEMIRSTKLSGIDGEALMEIRNIFAREGNRSKSRSARFVANEIDDLIRKQLDEVDAAAFDDQLNRYTTFLAHDAATAGKAATKNRGRFTEDELLASGKRFEGMGSSNRPRPMKEEAIQTFETLEQAKSAADKVIDDAKLGLLRAKEAAAAAAKTGRRAAADQKVVRLEQAVEAAKQQKRAIDLPGKTSALSDMKGKAVPARISPLSELLTTSYLGAIPAGLVGMTVGGPLGAVAGIAAGAATSSALGSQAGQRLVTGNTGVQGAMRDLATDRAREYAAELRRQAARLAAMGVN